MGLHEVAWLLAVLSTGTAAGAMAGHALLLGRFFGWVFESDRAETFRAIYPPFIRARRPQLLFDNLFTLSLLVASAYAALSWLAGRPFFLALAAAALQWLFVSIFFASGFVKLEHELLYEGEVSPERVRRFRALNAPVTALSTILLLGSFACLILTKA